MSLTVIPTFTTKAKQLGQGMKRPLNGSLVVALGGLAFVPQLMLLLQLCGKGL